MRWATLWRHGRQMAILAALALLAGCAPPFGASAPPHPLEPSVPPAATAAPAFSSFSDWRLAYLSIDGRLHVVSLDGKTDLTGALFSVVFDGQGDGTWTAGTAPNGQRLAVSSTADLRYIDLGDNAAARFQTIQFPSTLRSGLLYWSPDGSRIAVDGELGHIAIITAATGAIRMIPVPNLSAPKDDWLVGQVYGWLGDNHLAVEYLPGAYPNVPPSQMGTPQIAATLDSLDVTTGALRHIVTIRSSTMVAGQFSLASDGSVALFSNSDWRGFPFTPMAERMDFATGAITALPHVARLISQVNSVLQALWIPHTHSALVVVGPPGVSQASYDLIDLDRDSVTPVDLPAYPVAWSPDGQTLILAASLASSKFENGDGEDGPGPTGFGPFTLTAVTFDASWKIASSVTLTTKTMQIPTLGFVHTA